MKALAFLASWGPLLVVLAAAGAAAWYFRVQLAALLKGLPGGNLLVGETTAKGPAAGAAAQAALGKETSEAAVDWTSKKITSAVDNVPLLRFFTGVTPMRKSAFVVLDKVRTRDDVKILWDRWGTVRWTGQDDAAVLRYEQTFKANKALDPTRHRTQVSEEVEGYVFTMAERARLGTQSKSSAPPSFDFGPGMVGTAPGAY